MLKTIQRLLLVALYCFSVSNIQGQSDSADENILKELSLEKLLNLRVISVSKNSEFLFDAPLSASVITKEEIRRAGSTSIMEALRLAPGIIVREQTNGNYDIYIRGMDNVPPNSAFAGNSTTALVMLNNRPIYNYLKGGTFWETLPVDINDVEKIEIIRGPAAALYGPNALSGIINIITRRAEKDGFYSTANARTGSYSTYIANTSLEYRFNKQWSLAGSANFQSRERTQIAMYETFRNQWLTNPDYVISYINDTVLNPQEIYPHPARAMKKYAGNFYLNYDPAAKIKLGLSAGAQHSFSQRVSTENGVSPLSSVSSDSRYADLRAQINTLSAQVSYNEGTQAPDFQAGNKYDFTTLDINMEYAFVRRGLSIKPGLSYRNAVYDDTRYANVQAGNGIFNERALLTTVSGSLRAEYKLAQNKIRLVAGVMGSKFNYPDTSYLSYELAATWKVHKNHIVRAVYSTSSRSSTVYDSYVNQRFAFYPIGQNKYMQAQVEANRQLKLLTGNMFEVGYRGVITSRLSIDVELFSIRSNNYSAMMANDLYFKLEGSDTIVVMPYRTTNMPMSLYQHGLSVSLQYFTHKFQAKTFFTVQRSDMKNYSPYFNTPQAPPLPSNPNPAANNIYSGSGTTTPVESTPRVFGGASFSYLPSRKWTLNLNTYFYSSQTYYHASNAIFMDGVRGVDHIKGKCLINVNISHQLFKGLEISGSVRNALNDTSREFFQMDKVPVMVYTGIRWEFKN
ncbi:MAG TPA: TonB-dependent receptor plug domain-containing protein [Chitinophagaceae bacterium]|nr:TonB-dependent receptor plug domain-containing protein [Chitinophagaceae bacterium]